MIDFNLLLAYSLKMTLLLIGSILLIITYFIGAHKIIFLKPTATFVRKMLTGIYAVSICVGGLFLNGIVIYIILTVLTVIVGIVTIFKYVLYKA